MVEEMVGAEGIDVAGGGLVGGDEKEGRALGEKGTTYTRRRETNKGTMGWGGHAVPR